MRRIVWGVGGGCGGVVVARVLAVWISHDLRLTIYFFERSFARKSETEEGNKLFSKRYDVSFVERRRRLKSQTQRLSKQAQFLIGLTLAPPPVTLPVIERRRRSQDFFAGHASIKKGMLQITAALHNKEGLAESLALPQESAPQC